MNGKEHCLLAIFLALSAALLLAALGQQFARADFSARQDEGRVKFGAVYMTRNNPFYEVVDEEIRAAVEAHGDVLLSRDPALSAARQNEEIESLIAAGVRVLFITPVEKDALQPALEKAAAAHVLVLCIDTDVTDAQYVKSTIVSDNALAGEQCARDLMAKSDGEKIALLTHPGAISAEQRIAGFRRALADDPRFEIVAAAPCEGQLERAMPQTLALLAAHPEISCIMALNDPAAMGALAALDSRGLLGRVRVYGIDGAPETKEMILRGYMAATAAQRPREMGRLAAKTAYRLLAGEDVPPVLRLSTTLITRENAGDSLGAWN